MILNLLFGITSTTLAAPVGITAGIGIIFWAGLALFREVRRVNKADTLLDNYILRVEADNNRLRSENVTLEDKVHEKEKAIDDLLDHPRGEKK